jgi:hypothetical protein
MRPEGPTFNSRDRKVAVMMLEMIAEVRRTGINSCRPFGPHRLLGTRNPDLTVGAINLRRFAPPSSSFSFKVASGATALGSVNSLCVLCVSVVDKL